MMTDENRRLSALRDLDALDSPPTAELDALVDMVSRHLDTPIALVSLVDADRQWFKARKGLAEPETPRDVSFCTHAIQHAEVMAVADAATDPRFATSSLVTGAPFIRAYLGAPISLATGERVGTVCAIDTQPRDWHPDQSAYLARAAVIASAALEARDASIHRDKAAAIHHELVAQDLLTHSIVQSMSEGIVVQRADGEIVASNPAACQILGVSKDELHGRTSMDPRWAAVDADGNDFPGEHHPNMRAMALGREIRDVKMGIDAPGQGRRWLKVNAVPMFRPGEPTAYQSVATFTDVTDITSHAEKLDRALQLAEEASSAKERFIANVSHEIRTPLNAILGMAQILHRGDLAPPQQQQVDTILQAGRGLTALLNDVLDMSKIDAGKFSIALADENPGQIIQGLYRLWQPQAQEKGIDLLLDLPPDLPPLKMDATRVQQCVGNLLSNAVKFTAEGEVRLTVRRPTAETLQISVKDTGIGMPQAALDRLFQPFEQASIDTSAKFGGTGLGLAVTSKLAELMGGGITVESAPGVGSTFTITIAARPCAAAPADGPAPVTGPLPGQKTVLIVDDNPTNRLVCSLFLKPLGLNIIEAENGQAALDALEAHPVDLVVLDMVMPVMDGPATIRAIRALPGPTSSLPVLCLTADAREDTAAKVRALGMDGYLTKPISERDLLSEMRRLLSRGQTPATATTAA